MSKNKILLIHNVLWSHYKGIVFTELAKMCSSNGFDFKVIQIAKSLKTRKNIGSIDTNYHNYNYKLLFDSFWEETSLINRFYHIAKEIKSYKPNLIILNGYSDLSIFLITILCRLLKIKIIQTSDSNRIDKKRFYLLEKLKFFILNQAEIIFCYGEMQKNYLLGLGIKKDKIHIRYQSTITERYIKHRPKFKNILNEIRDKDYFLYVGRLSKEKNLFTLIDSFSRIKSNWQLVIIGDGPQYSQLNKYIIKNNLNNIFFIGGLPWEKVIDYYYHSKVFILPSVSEPWGLVVNEAMLCKKPVIVSSNCGCSESLVINRYNGFKIDPYTNIELTNAMNFFIENQSVIDQWGLNSFKIIKDYTPKHSANQMLNGINKVI